MPAAPCETRAPRAPRRPRIAAIDAGSNGVRLLIGEVDRDGRITVILHHRAALRLGADAFAQGFFSEESLQRATEVFRTLRAHVDQHGVTHMRAIATSAARDAANADELARRIRESTAIELEIIDPREEARLLCSAVAACVDLRGRSALLVDMGGGSVDLAAVSGGRLIASDSLPLGPVRLLTKLREEKQPEQAAIDMLTPLAPAINELLHSFPSDPAPDALPDEAQPTLCIGIGGNIEALADLRSAQPGPHRASELAVEQLRAIHQRLLALSLSDRIDQLHLQPDRADVIAIAATVLLEIMRHARFQRILCPRVSLSEEVLREAALLLGNETNRTGTRIDRRID